MKKRYIALGDSYTFCEGVDWKNEWTHRLAAESNLELVKVVAASGWTSADLLQKCEKYLRAYSFDIATLFIGVNDWFDGVSVGEFGNNLKKLICLLREKNADVRLITIPDYLISPLGLEKTIGILNEAKSGRFTDGKTIHDFNEVIKAAGAEFDLSIVDLENVLGENDYKDGLHPNETGIKKWLDEIKKSFQNYGK